MAQFVPYCISKTKAKPLQRGKKNLKQTQVSFWHAPVLAPKATSPAAGELTVVIHSLVQMGIRGFVGPAGSHEFAVRMGGQLCVWEGVAPSLVDFSFVMILASSKSQQRRRKHVCTGLAALLVRGRIMQCTMSTQAPPYGFPLLEVGQQGGGAAGQVEL